MSAKTRWKEVRDIVPPAADLRARQACRESCRSGRSSRSTSAARPGERGGAGRGQHRAVEGGLERRSRAPSTAPSSAVAIEPAGPGDRAVEAVGGADMLLVDRRHHRVGQRRHRAGHAQRDDDQRREQRGPVRRARPPRVASAKAGSDHQRPDRQRPARADPAPQPAHEPRRRAENERDRQQRGARGHGTEPVILDQR
jgi:hypothetical protein